ncbi:MAG: hypothetical protein LAT68_05025 [Cyclobacteriaceae bacterium]|nr:hypothetical protein [Cyclobacteriaceae bacterium]MCH8515673.1 hypothetical protein [Cyclobacteriaceae bacterium]
MERKQKNNERKGLVATVIFHGLLLLFFALSLAWREPDPPLPEYGVELNLGFETVGSGDQTSTEEEISDEETDSPDEMVEEVIEAEAVEEAAAEEPAPDETFDDPEGIPADPKPTTSSSTAEEKAKEKKKEVKEAPKPKPDPYAAAKSGSGDDDKKGDAGDPEGQPDKRALMGTAGGGQGGAALDMAGWQWDQIPRPDDRSAETGTITFEITIDQNGKYLKDRILKSTVPADVVNVYRSELRELTFSPTGGSPKGNTTGRITFTLRSR